MNNDRINSYKNKYREDSYKTLLEIYKREEKESTTKIDFNIESVKDYPHFKEFIYTYVDITTNPYDLTEVTNVIDNIGTITVTKKTHPL